MTQIKDEKTGKITKYDMSTKIDQIDVAAAKAAEEAAAARAAEDAANIAAAAAANEAAAAAANEAADNNDSSSTTPETPWTNQPYENMTPAQQATATAIALEYNQVIEADSKAVNIARYGEGAVFSYPPAATIWNPNTGLKKAVRLDMTTGKIWDEDFSALPDDLNPDKGGNWQLWTGGMASGTVAQAAITGSQPSSQPTTTSNAAVSTITTPVTPVAPMATLWSADGRFRRQVLIGSADAANLQADGWLLDKPTPAPAATSAIPTGWIYINDSTQLVNIPDTYIKRDGAKMYLDPAKVQYVGTMAEVAKIPANRRVLLNGKYYKIL